VRSNWVLVAEYDQLVVNFEVVVLVSFLGFGDKVGEGVVCDFFLEPL
jgi:hypothetical protein